MSFSSIIGSIGVTLLLLAFGLNLFRYISQDSRTYVLLNVLGAALSCYASVLIHYTPFIILEATWCLVALFSLAGKKKVPAE